MNGIVGFLIVVWGICWLQEELSYTPIFNSSRGENFLKILFKFLKIIIAAAMVIVPVYLTYFYGK